MNTYLIKPLIIVSVIVLLASCGKVDDKNKIYVEPPRIVKTEILKVFNGSIERHITGRLQAAENTSLSFEVSGVLKNVHVNLGESFTQGQLLAELDNQLYQLAADQRSGLLGESSAAKFEAKQNLDRNLTLKKQKLVSQALVDNAQAAYNIASERVKSAQSALNIANKNLADTKLYAPYSGSVSAQLVEPSQQISTQTPIFAIQGTANLEVNAVVPESIVGRITLGKQVIVHIPALGDSRNYEATLTEIGTQASIANAFPITITFNKKYLKLLPGMSAEIILPIQDQRYQSDQDASNVRFEIPLNAVATDTRGQYVQVIMRKNDTYTTHKHYIEIEQTLSNSLLTQLNSLPVDIRDRNNIEVVTAGLVFIADQQEVMPLNKIQQIYNQ